MRRVKNRGGVSEDVENLDLIKYFDACKYRSLPLHSSLNYNFYAVPTRFHDSERYNEIFTILYVEYHITKTDNGLMTVATCTMYLENFP